MRTSLSISLLIFALGWAGSVRSAKIAYVTDMIQLGLHAASDTRDCPTDSLPGGIRLEVLVRSTHNARVRTPSGEEGWVKAAFIVWEAPALFRVDALEREVGALREQLSAARETEH